MFKLDSPSPTPSRHSKTLVRQPFASLHISLFYRGYRIFSGFVPSHPFWRGPLVTACRTASSSFRALGLGWNLACFCISVVPGPRHKRVPLSHGRIFLGVAQDQVFLVRNITAFLHPSGRASDKIFANIFAGRGIGRPWHVCDILSHLKSQRKSVLT